MQPQGGPRVKTKPARRHRRTPSRGQHRHSKSHCLKILRRLSAYLDDELPGKLCREIRKHLGACPKCEIFLSSLKQTVNLCRHSPTRPLSTAAKTSLRRKILRLTSAH